MTQPKTDIAVTTTAQNMPEIKFRAGAISATVWKNNGKNAKNEDYAYYTISVERNFINKDEKWQSTN